MARVKDGAPTKISRRRWLAAGAASVAGGFSFSLKADPEPKPKTHPAQQKVSALAGWVAERKGRVSALARDLETADVLFSTDPDVSLNPASNMKIVTAAAALDLLGPQYSFETGVYGDVKGTSIDPLVLRGNGDPSLTEAGLWRLANALATMGIEHVGKVLVDQSRFDDQFVPPAFEQQPNEWAAFRAPVSAIAVDRNTVMLNVVPTTPNQPARVWFQPAGVVSVQGDITTRDEGKGQNIQLSLLPGKQQLIGKVDGHVALGLPRQRFTKRVDDPRPLPGLVLAALLRREGVKVDSVEVAASKAKRRITYHGAEPLFELVSELGKYSDNFYAEMIFKALATSAADGPSTWTKASEVVGAWLRKNDAFGDGTVIKNGSGLFDANRLSAQTLVRTLAVAYGSPRLRNEFVSQLSIGGVDGTLRGRFRSLRGSRRVRAKTGTLNAVNALSGYVLKPRSGAPVAFSILVDGVPGRHAAIRGKMDQVVEALAAS